MGLNAFSPQKMDSLRQKAQSAVTDTSRILTYIEMAKLSMVGQKDSTFSYLEKAKKNIDKTDFKRGKVFLLGIQVQQNILQSQFEKGLALGKEMNNLAMRLNMLNEAAIAFNNMATCEMRMSNLDKAIDDFIAAANLFEKAGIKPKQAAVLGNIGTILLKSNQTEKALPYFEQAYALQMQLKDTLRAAYPLLNMGICAKRMNKPELAERHLLAVLRISQQKKDKEMEFGANINYGELLLGQKKYTETEKYYRQAYEIATALQSNDMKVLAIQSLGDYYFRLKNYTAAQKYVAESIEIGRKNADNLYLMNNYKLMANILDSLHQYEKSLFYYQQYDALKDTVRNVEMQKNTEKLEAEYQTAKKEKAIIQKDLEISRKNNFLVFALLGILGLAFLLLWLRQKQQLQAQKLATVEKEQEIALLKALQKGEETERKRLAADLHDGVGGLLTSAKLQFDTLKYQLTILQGSADFEKGIELLDKAHQELRQVSHHISPEILNQLGLVEALRDYCEGIEKSSHLVIDFQAFEVSAIFSEEKKLHIYRIIQELLQNVLKHAEAKSVILQLMGQEKGLTITVEDDGKGWVDTHEAKGIGWANVQSRLALLGGKATVHAEKGGGTSIEMILRV